MLSWRFYDVSGQGAEPERERDRRHWTSPTASVPQFRQRLFALEFCRNDKVIAWEPHSTLRSAESLNEMRKHV
jgi:hypothetical protein